MIKIVESTTKKVPGLSSVMVSFNYNPEIVTAIKQVSGAVYDKSTKEWEVPVSSLSKLLDILCKYDDISLEILPEDKPKKEINYDLGSFKTTPFEYQKEGIEYGLNHDNFLLLDAPGLGKSLQIIYIAEKLKELEGLEHCLIICGINTLKHNWKKEIERHSKLSCRILGERTNTKGRTYIGSVKERLEDLKNPIDEFFVITNCETLRNSDIVNEIKKGKNNKFDMIAVDEIHKCVSKDTLITTDKGQIPIKNIKPGDLVLSYNINNNSTEYNKVLNIFKNPNFSALLKLTILDDNNIEHTIQCTPDHKIYTLNRGFIEAQYITSTDIIEIN